MSSHLRQKKQTALRNIITIKKSAEWENSYRKRATGKKAKLNGAAVADKSSGHSTSPANINTIVPPPLSLSPDPMS